MKTLLVASALLLFAGVSQADSVWTYAGNNVSGATNLGPLPVVGPNPCQCALSGTVTLDSLGQAVGWDFTDGTHTLTNLNSVGAFSTSYGIPGPGTPFFTWLVLLQGQGVTMLTEFY